MSVILGLLSYIPGFLTFATAITNKAFDTKVALYQAKTGAARDVAVAAITAAVTTDQAKAGWIAALAQNPIMMGIVVGFALPPIIYEWKVIVYDNVWAYWGKYYTPAIGGSVADWATTILYGIFLTGGGLGIAHAWLKKDDEKRKD